MTHVHHGSHQTPTRLFPRSLRQHTNAHCNMLVTDSSTNRACDLLVFPSFAPSLVLSPSFTYCPIPLSPSRCLTFVLWGRLQGRVRQAPLSGLPPSSAPLSVELTVMNERCRGGRGRGGERGRGGLSLCDEGGRDKERC